MVPESFLKISINVWKANQIQSLDYIFSNKDFDLAHRLFPQLYNGTAERTLVDSLTIIQYSASASYGVNFML